MTQDKIKDATTSELVALLVKADQDLTSFSWAIRVAVPELLRRIEAGGSSVTKWIDEATLEELHAMSEAVAVALDTVPAQPKPPTIDPDTDGRDRIDGATPSRSHSDACICEPCMERKEAKS